MMLKKVFARIVACFMPTKTLRSTVRDYLTFGFGKTHYRGGKNNKIVYIDKNQKKHYVHRLSGCNIYFYGDNNYVEIHGPLNALHLEATLCGESKIIIRKSTHHDRDFKILGMKKCSLDIGENFYINGQLFLEFTENTCVTIGKDCVFSYDITIRTGDGHKIKSLETGEIINPNQDIVIGNHVWIACKAMILKGAIISDNSIVAAGSLVNKKFYESNVILAGTPAQIKKTHIQWEY